MDRRVNHSFFENVSSNISKFRKIKERCFYFYKELIIKKPTMNDISQLFFFSHPHRQPNLIQTDYKNRELYMLLTDL